MIMPQLTIGRLMLAIAGIGLAMGVLQVYTVPALITLYFLALAGMAWFVSHAHPKVAFWGFLISAAWLDASIFVMLALAPVFHNAMLLSLASLVFVPIVPGFGLAWLATRTGWASRLRAAGIVACAVALAVSMLVTRWPFQLAFYISSPALNRLADRVEAGGSVTPGERAGMYRVSGSMTIAGDTTLIIDPSPSGRSGFIRRAGSTRSGRREWLDPEHGRSDRWGYLDED